MPRCCEPIESVSNQSNTLSFASGGMPGPWSLTVNTTASGRRSAASVTVAPAGEKPTALDEQVEQNLPQAPLVGAEAADAGRGADLERQIVLHQPVLHAFGRRLHAGADVDLAQVQRHGAGVDGGEVEDVVDEREQRIGGGRDVAEIFVLLVGERAECRVAQQIREADDVGERRAQFVGHVVHEIDLDGVGGFQRLVLLAQRALDIHRVADVLEGDQRGAVGQRHRGHVDHHAVAPLDARDDRLAVVDGGHRGA